MIAQLIHPADLDRLLNATESCDVVFKMSGPYQDDLIEVNGVLYYQTLRVPEIGDHENRKSLRRG